MSRAAGNTASKENIAIRQRSVVEAPRKVLSKEHAVKRSAENKLKVVAVRVDPAIERRLKLLADATGRRQSFFLQQMIENGIAAMEEAWLPPAVLAQVRDGTLPAKQSERATAPDLFSDLFADQDS